MSGLIEIKIPDIGDFTQVEVIEVLVNIGDQILEGDPLLTLEGDKASMEVPSPTSGKISEIIVQAGQMVSKGTLIMRLSPEDSLSKEPNVVHGQDLVEVVDNKSEENTLIKEPDTSKKTLNEVYPKKTFSPIEKQSTISIPHASPSIRRLARELGADLNQINGSGSKGRILKTDVKKWVNDKITHASVTDMSKIPALPDIDFSQFGKIEIISLSRIKKISGTHLKASWMHIPHVTHHDEADITDLEEFRQSIKVEANNEGIRVTLLPFIIKILSSALKKFPNFNSSLHPDGNSLILKKYCHIGIAVNTNQGLVVPILKNVDKKSIFEIAREISEILVAARDGNLKPEDLKGGSMTLSSLGKIGGTAFTPIVNSPEVAILGISRSKISPVWNGEQFHSRLILPLNLSYDHRVIDGIEAATFSSYLIQTFRDIRRLSL